MESDIQNENIKRAQINAKITFAIWVLEMLSFVVMIVVAKIWKNFEITLTFFIFFLHVALPFTFLKNSSENKQRLMDVSVLNIIQNFIGARKIKRIYPSLEVATVAATLDVNYTTVVVPQRFVAK